jgi:hypothetical protein
VTTIKSVRSAFEPTGVVIAIRQLKFVQPLRATVKQGAKYRQILTSVRAVGLVEPPVVIAITKPGTGYLVLDGQLRIEALKDLGVTNVSCLVATDDEAFTYNKRINRLSATHENRMIVRALSIGVSKADLANALGVDADTIRRRAKLLDAIAPDVVELLKETMTPMAVFDILRQMKPLRQFEAAQIMVGQGVFTTQFANALLAATPPAQLSKVPGRQASSQAQFVRMERELSALQVQIKDTESRFGLDTLHLTVARAYLRRMLGSASIVLWLAQNRPEYLAEFQHLAKADESAAGMDWVGA